MVWYLNEKKEIMKHRAKNNKVNKITITKKQLIECWQTEQSLQRMANVKERENENGKDGNQK